MEAEYSTETLVTVCQTTWCCQPEHFNMNIDCREDVVFPVTYIYFYHHTPLIKYYLIL